MLRRLLSLLPTTATAPFCPSAVEGSIDIPPNLSFWKKVLAFSGPGLLVSVGYMDPGNWATDIAAGSQFGYNLLFVVAFSSMAAIVLQCLCVRLGIASDMDLAQASRARYPRPVNLAMWALAEIAIIATDVAEVLGSALAFHLLLGCSLKWGIAITALDTVIILGLKGRGFRQVEAIVLGLVLTIAGCYFVELFLAGPNWVEVSKGLIPDPRRLASPDAWYLAVGILGATVMPHNLYLHSSIAQTRRIAKSDGGRKEAIRLSTVDTTLSLFLAFLVNAAILVLAGAAFHHSGNTQVAEIDDAYRLLEPLMGSALAPLLFGIALLASGQSSTFTGTIAGQIIMEGYLDLKIPCWQRRLITRGLALLPAFFGVWLLGDGSTGKLLVLSQVVLSLQLPFAIFPLIRFTSDEKLMGKFQSGVALRTVAWMLFAAIVGANIVMIASMLK
jgi:manganese transport protein